MRTIEYTNAFKRDYKREKSGKSRQHADKLDRDLTEVVALLAADTTPPRRYADHPLTGDWKDFPGLPHPPRSRSHLPKAGCR
jgi:mRNA interferase YafQ